MNYKGVCYDVGRQIVGQDNRPDYTPEIVHRELKIIKDDLHCNAVRICGQDIGRLTAATETAIDQGLQVWLSPELWDHAPKETLEYIAEAAAVAEVLRNRWPDKFVLTIGSELTFFMKGILDGTNIIERFGSPMKLALTMLRLKLLRSYNKSLNTFLEEACYQVRKVFHGPISYASAPIEDVDWSLFDIVSVDYYRGKANRASYGERLKRYRAYGKPVVITEFGCCTYQGAEDKGGRAFMAVDRKNPERLNRIYTRDERLQAGEDIYMLRLLEKAGVNGAFVFTFVTPTLRYSSNPIYDFDMVSYSLVKSFSNNEHGTTYPDMTWEPKESFKAIAEYYAKH